MNDVKEGWVFQEEKTTVNTDQISEVQVVKSSDAAPRVEFLLRLEDGHHEAYIEDYNAGLNLLVQMECESCIDMWNMFHEKE